MCIRDSSMRARDQEAQKGIDSFADITAPVHGYAEQVYYYDLKDREDVVYAGVYNPKQKLGVYIKYFKSQLPYLCLLYTSACSAFSSKMTGIL